MRKIRHLVEQSGRFSFKPSRMMRAAGFSGKEFGTDRNQAVEYVETQNAEWDRIRKTITTPETTIPGTFSDLIDRFEKDPTWYGKKAHATRDEIDYAFRIIREVLGHHPVRLIERRHGRGFYNKLRIDEGFSVHKTRKVMKWAIRLIWYAIEIGVRDDHPWQKLDMERPQGRREVWTPDEIESVIAAAESGGKASSGNVIPARPSVALATRIAYDTALPQQDVLALTWPQYDGDGLTVKQIKPRGDRNELYLPLSVATREILDGMDKTSTHIVVSEETGLPYTDRRIFSRSFRRFRDRAGVSGKTFQDIRRTALTELGNRGATEAEITRISGHKIGSRVIDVYVRPDRTAAISAANKRWKKLD